MLCYLILVATLINLSVTISSKKGVGINSGKGAFRCGDTWLFDEVSWWYDWHYNQPELRWNNCKNNSAKHGYIPMIADQRRVSLAVIPDNARFVLGFNEPNIDKQSDLSPEESARLWPEVERKSANQYLVGPALAGCGIDPEYCIDWYATFFLNCHNCRVNAIAMHDYHHCEDRHPSLLMESIEKISKRFGRKIWLTEFSCKGSVSVDGHLEFMKVILPLLEESPYVERYAWFVSRIANTDTFLQTKNTALLVPGENRLSRLGQFYNDFEI